MATAELGTKPFVLPGHLDLPSEDGTFVRNNREHPQSILLTEAILPVVRERHPDGRYLIGQDMGIYWRLTDPPLNGVKAPDWYYVPDVPATLEGEFRRSYVLWKEFIAPRIILEFASGDGSEERDTTPWHGKFWVYEKVIRPAIYAIFDVMSGELEAYQFVGARFERITPNERGRVPIPGLDVELGVWHGYFINEQAPWLRWWDRRGELLPIDAERVEVLVRRADAESRRAEAESRRADVESRRAEAESRRADAFASRLRELGVDPDEVADSA